MTEIIVGTLIVGYVLDLIFGDPHGMWHPICFIGNMISFFERRLQSDCVHEQVAKADCEYPIHKLFLYDIYPANNYDTEEL